MVALVALSGCGGPLGSTLVDFDPAKLPLNVYLACDFGDNLAPGVDVRCSGTFADLDCSTSAGVELACSAGVATSLPIVGTIAGTVYAETSVDTESGWSGDVTACSSAGAFRRCASVESVPRLTGSESR
jgi:hypothetical protein